MSRQFITKSANNIDVFVDTEHSHAATHLHDEPKLIGLAADIIGVNTLDEPEVVVEHDAGHIIGNTDVVVTTPQDDIVYAKRLNRDNYTRFVKNRQVLPTPFVTLVLRRNEDTGYDLWSIWIGPRVPSFPGDDRNFPDSKVFWSNHALVWGNQDIQPGTETTVCPW